MAYFSEEQLRDLGFAYLGSNVRVSTRASLYNFAAISLGDDVRIDDFCLLSAGRGGISIGCNVHVAAYSSLIGAGKIDLGDFSNLSSRVSIYSSSDDYSGEWMTNPTVPPEYTNVDTRDVFIGKHVIIGAGSVVLPGVKICDGAAIGALSLVSRDVPAYTICTGVPAKIVKERSKRMLTLEQEFVGAKSLFSRGIAE